METQSHVLFIINSYLAKKEGRKGFLQREEKRKREQDRDLFAGNNLDWTNVYGYIFAPC